jgi:hypothetical protein
MFNPMRKNAPTELDREITAVYTRMQVVGPADEEYPELLKHAKTLEKLKAQAKANKRRLSPDTVLLVAGNLLGILIVVNYERVHVWTTRSTNVAPPIPNPKI